MNFYFKLASAKRSSSSMKNSECLIIGFFVILTITMTARADIRRDCRKQTNVSWGALKKLKAGNFNQDDQKLKCYLQCFMMKNGIIGNDNEVDVEKALRHLPERIQASSKKVLSKCKDLPSTDACDKAFQIVRCYFKFQPEILKRVSFV